MERFNPVFPTYKDSKKQLSPAMMYASPQGDYVRHADHVAAMDSGWHDLAKDPADLPPEDVRVIVAMGYPWNPKTKHHMETMTMHNGGWWHSLYNGHVQNVLAWHALPPYGGPTC